MLIGDTFRFVYFYSFLSVYLSKEVFVNVRAMLGSLLRGQARSAGVQSLFRRTNGHKPALACYRETCPIIPDEGGSSFAADPVHGLSLLASTLAVSTHTVISVFPSRSAVVVFLLKTFLIKIFHDTIYVYSKVSSFDNYVSGC